MGKPIWYTYSVHSYIALSSVTLKIVCYFLYNENSTSVFKIAQSQYITTSKRIIVSTGKNTSSKKKFSKTVPEKKYDEHLIWVVGVFRMKMSRYVP